MKIRNLTALIIAAAVLLPVIPASADGEINVRLDPSAASPFNGGRFEGWGTSMGWWGNRLGHSDKMSQQAAVDLYSEKGLGLDIVRYNVGGGDDPSHKHINRSDSMLPCFAVPEYNSDSTLKRDENGDVMYAYNWDNDHDQLNVLKRIKEQNPNVHIEGYTNSPPWFMTNSGCSSGGVNASENLDTQNYDVFVKFLADVTEHMSDIGLKFDSYSPMNEPNPVTKYWGAFSPKQEGNHVAQGEHQSALIKALKDEYVSRDIDTLVAGLDETDIGFSITAYEKLTDDAKAALDRLDTHTYGGSDRAGLKRTAVNAGKNLWMSEVDAGWNGFGLADRIIEDLNGMQASAWVMWDIIDFHRDSDFVDQTTGNKTEANNTLNPTAGLWGVGMGNHDTETVEWANKYYAYGQFTRYINPGDTLIASSDSTLAAYNKESGDIKIVTSNSSSSDRKYAFDLSAFRNVGSSVKVIRSNNETGDAAEHWKEITGAAALQGKTLTADAKAGTITTYIIEGSKAAEYAVINIDDSGLLIGDTVDLVLDTNIEGATAWSVDKPDVAQISQDGKLTINKSGTIIVTADIDGFSVSKTIVIPLKIYGGGTELSRGDVVRLSANINEGYSGSVLWAVDNEDIAGITQDGLLTVKKSGTVTVTLTVEGESVTKTFEIPEYKLSGTASWGNDSTAPADSADYRKAADGNLATFFDGNRNGWVMYDYGIPYKADKIRLAARSGHSARTKGGKVQGSNDAIEWTDLYEITSEIPSDAYTDVTPSGDKAYRYYRYTNPSEMTNIAEFLIEGAPSDNTPENAPTVKDISELTDNFDRGINIFGAPNGNLTENGNQIYASGRERFGNVFVPVKSTGTVTLTEPVELTDKDRFRISFNMFAGWEDGGRDNTFALKDKDGNELAAIYITGGGYTLQEIRIGGANVLTNTGVAQCRSNAGSNNAGANGWNHSSQPYRNNMGFNKTVEIIIDGTGTVSVSFTGGMEDTVVSGVIRDKEISIGSMELTGDFNASRDRVAAYDNFDADVITYASALPEPPKPTEPPVLPDDGTIISLDFNGNLDSASAYGTAEGNAKFAQIDGRQALQLDNTAETALKLTDANGNGLLTGQEEITVSFSFKQTNAGTSWWFYSAPNDKAQTYNSENYIGALGRDGRTLSVERYNNGRSATADGAFTLNEWHNVMISYGASETVLYIDGVQAAKADSAFKISDMLGENPVAYIGRANWGSGEYAAGYIDDFVIKKGALKSALGDIDLGDTTRVKGDIKIPQTEGITWESSNPDIVSADGKVTRGDDTVTVTLTASDENGNRREFKVTVIGYAMVADTFAAYYEDGSIKFTTDSDEGNPYQYITALYKDGKLENVMIDAPSGSFDGVEGGVYKVSFYLWDGMTPKHDKVTKTVEVRDEVETTAYLMAHFIGTEKNSTDEQVYFTVSTDAMTWKTLNNKTPVLTSTESQKGIRDPYILRGRDGGYYIIATDLSIVNGGLNWTTCQREGSRNIVVWKSDDLVNWEYSLHEVMPEGAGCVWAPEAVYDVERGEYMVFWASKTSEDNYNKQRIYRCYTSDFETFTPAEVYIEEDHSVIDTTIVCEKGVYYRFNKYEGQNFVYMEKSAALNGDWVEVGTYNHKETGFEGPTIFKMGDSGKWCLMLDNYTKGGYQPFMTEDLSTGVFESPGAVTFDSGVTYRHGTVLPITRSEYDAVMQKYGK